jgi:(4-alkanoyl-5-oxo-2,5-dihydrofuran-3-yl)methyl phosphate reductase
MILVTGASGNVGSQLVPRLLAAGQSVRVLVRDPTRVAHLASEVERVIGDLDKAETLTDACDGVQAIYLISQAGQVGTVIQAAQHAGVKHIVRQSTLEAGFNPPLGPGRWHREAELTIERSGLAYTHLRPTMMMVNTLSWWAPNIRTKRVVFFPGGEGRLSPVDSRDIAAVAVAVLTQPGHEGRAYEVTGPQLLSFGDMVAIIAQTIAKDLRYIDVEESAAGEQMVKFGMQPDLVAGLLETMAGVRADKFAYVVPLLTGVAARTWDDWCLEHKAAFLPVTA